MHQYKSWFSLVSRQLSLKQWRNTIGPAIETTWLATETHPHRNAHGQISKNRKNGIKKFNNNTKMQNNTKMHHAKKEE